MSFSLPTARRQLELIEKSWVWVFGAMLCTLPFLENFWPSFEGTKASYRGAMGLAALLYIWQGVLLELTAASTAGEGRGGAAKRIAFWLLRFAGLYAAIMGAAHVVGLAWSKYGDISFLLIAIRNYLSLPVVILALVLTRRENPVAPADGRWLRGYYAVRWLMVGIFVLSFFSAAASFHPIESLRDFREDIGSTIAVTLILLDVLRSSRLIRRLCGVFLAIAIYIALINFLALYRFAFTTEVERLAWIDMGIVYSAGYLDAPTEVRHQMGRFDYRPVFPFRHHNRLSNFAMMAAAVGLVLVSWPGVRWLKRLRYGGGALLAFVLLQLTMGRGAWLAFFGGVLVAALLMFSPRRRSHWLLAGGIAMVATIGFGMLSPFQKNRLGSAFRSLPQLVAMVVEPDTAQWPEDLNMRRRLIAMKTAVRATRDNPLLGTGYGYHTYERLVPDYQPTNFERDPQESEQYQSHSHNNLLQIAAETGLPTLVLYALLHLVAFVLCAAAVRTAHRRHLPLRWPATFALALFLMTHAYGMTNYSLRYTIGHLTWTLQIICVMLALRAVTETAPDEALAEPEQAGDSLPAAG